MLQVPNGRLLHYLVRLRRITAAAALVYYCEEVDHDRLEIQAMSYILPGFLQDRCL